MDTSLIRQSPQSLLSASLITPTLTTLLSQNTPGYKPIHSFFSTWLHIDLTKLALLLTLCGLFSTALSELQSTTRRFTWWIARFVTVSISIAPGDPLNKEVLEWLGAHVLKPKVPGLHGVTSRGLTARSDSPGSYRDDTAGERRAPLQYLPSFNTVWFMHERTIIIIRRLQTSIPNRLHTPRIPGEDPLVVMSLGRNPAAIKRFLSACRAFTDEKTTRFVTVRTTDPSTRSGHWSISVTRPLRSLDSVHFDRAVKDELIRDITTFLHPATHRFYGSRGIPYRRGYLLYGPPGTGKTSLSLALATHFNFDLHLIHLPSLLDDSDLEALFVSLPSRCLVLLEDIDCVGLSRRPPSCPPSPAYPPESPSSSEAEEATAKVPGQISLSGILNVLDGVTSQEGRIILMTSNHPTLLDSALIRPGRIDKKIHLGLLSKTCAGEMFLRMYDETPSVTAEQEDIFSDTASVSTNPFATVSPRPAQPPTFQSPWSKDTLHRLAFQFAEIIPHERFSPASVQGFLLDHKDSPFDAMRNVDEWVVTEITRIDEAERQSRRIADKRLKRMRSERLKKKVKEIQEENALQESMRSSLALQLHLRQQEKSRHHPHQATVESISDSDPTTPPHRRKHKRRTSRGNDSDGSQATTRSTVSRAPTITSLNSPFETTSPWRRHHRRKSSLQTKAREALMGPTAPLPMETIEQLIIPVEEGQPEEEKVVSQNVREAGPESSKEATKVALETVVENVVPEPKMTKVALDTVVEDVTPEPEVTKVAPRLTQCISPTQSISPSRAYIRPPPPAPSALAISTISATETSPINPPNQPKRTPSNPSNPQVTPHEAPKPTQPLPAIPKTLPTSS